VDLYIRSGTYPVKPSLPYTPGSDAAGDIKDVGPGVTSFKPGDRVYVAAPDAGTYAESVVTAASRGYPLPAAASYGHGAALGVPYAAACRALFQRGNARPGETVLVLGLVTPFQAFGADFVLRLPGCSRTDIPSSSTAVQRSSHASRRLA